MCTVYMQPLNDAAIREILRRREEQIVRELETQYRKQNDDRAKAYRQQMAKVFNGFVWLFY